MGKRCRPCCSCRRVGEATGAPVGRCTAEVSTDHAPAYPRVLGELLPSACHITEQYATTGSKPVTIV